MLNEIFWFKAFIESTFYKRFSIAGYHLHFDELRERKMAGHMFDLKARLHTYTADNGVEENGGGEKSRYRIDLFYTLDVPPPSANVPYLSYSLHCHRVKWLSWTRSNLALSYSFLGHWRKSNSQTLLICKFLKCMYNNKHLIIVISIKTWSLFIYLFGTAGC